MLRWRRGGSLHAMLGRRLRIRRGMTDHAPIDLTGHSADDAASAGRHEQPQYAEPPRSIQKFEIEYVSLPKGILDPSILSRVDAIAQQCNCVGCDGRGLADAVAKTLPYGCSYKSRRRMPPANKFAIPSDRAVPGTIEVRKPPKTLPGVDKRPSVLNLFAQWEMGAPGKYNRVQPAPESDSARQREAWFAQCLQAISVLEPKPASIAFPHQIGCGLAGGNWGRYAEMLKTFAQANPDIHVIVCHLKTAASTSSRQQTSRDGNRGGARGAHTQASVVKTICKRQ